MNVENVRKFVVLGRATRCWPCSRMTSSHMLLDWTYVISLEPPNVSDLSSCFAREDMTLTSMFCSKTFCVCRVNVQQCKATASSYRHVVGCGRASVI